MQAASSTTTTSGVETMSDEALREKILKEYAEGKVVLDLFPGGHFGTIGVAIAAIASIVSFWIVLSSPY